MILNSNNSQFIFKFPSDFLTPEIVEKYNPQITRFPIPYEKIIDYLNHSIQAVTWPQISLELVQQETFNRKADFKGGKSAERQFEKTIDVTFKTNESYINYFIMLDLLLGYWKIGEHTPTFLPDLSLYLLDHSGYVTLILYFEHIVFSGLSSLELSYTDLVPEYKSFTATFNFERFSIKNQIDGKIQSI